MDRFEEMLDEEEEGLEKPEPVRKKWIAIILMGFASVAILVYIGITMFMNRTFSTYEQKVLIAEEVGNNQFEAYDGGLLKYSRDGACAYNAKGDVVWNGSYEYQNPQADVNGKYVLIYDLEGKHATIFNGSDSGKEITATKTITGGRVSAGGVVALVLEDDETNGIQLYNPYAKGENLLVDIPTNISDGYPVDMALSQDGNSVVSSYMKAEGGEISSSITFYNFSKVGQDKDSLVGAEKYGTTIVPKIEFLGEDMVCLFTTEGFSIWENLKQPEKKSEVKIDGEVKSIFYSEKYVGVVKERANKDSDYQIVLYNVKGKEVMKTETGFEYNQIWLHEDEIHMYNDSEWKILQTNGKWKMECETENDVAYIFPSSESTSYFMIGEDGIQLVKTTNE